MRITTYSTSRSVPVGLLAGIDNARAIDYGSNDSVPDRAAAWPAAARN